MNEEKVMDEVVETFNNIEVEEVIDIKPSSGGGLLKTVGILGVCGAVGAAALHFTKKKREEWTIKKLEKKGYIVTKAEVVDDDEDFDEDFEFVEEESEENEK